MPLLVVVPGLILFAMHPEILLRPWAEVQPEADKGYVRLLQAVVPAGLGEHWYSGVVLWWLLFCGLVLALMLSFSGLVFG